MITIGPDITISSRHRCVSFAITSSVNGSATLTCDLPGLVVDDTTVTLIANTAVNINATISQSNKTYTITVLNSANADTDSCTVTIESAFAQVDLSTINDTITTAMESITPSEQTRIAFTAGPEIDTEEELHAVEPRCFYLGLQSYEQGGSPDIHTLEYGIVVMYQDEVITNDLISIRNQLNCYDWPSGIHCWCPSITVSNYNNTMPTIEVLLLLEIYS